MRQSEVVALTRAPDGGLAGCRVGRIVAFEGATPLVDFPENGEGPMPAQILEGETSRLAALDAKVVLMFDSGSPRAPIVVGVLAAPPSEAPLQRAEGAALEASIDGKRVAIEGKDEIVLRCGAASITLRRNGRVIIRGVYVETRAEGVNRIRGGAVRIN